MKNPGSEYQYGTRKNIKRSAQSTKKTFSAIPIALMTVLALAGAIMLVMSLFVRVELTEINDKNVELKQNLEQLQEENRRLRIEYEFAQNLDEIEKEAKGRLGMQSAFQRQTETIDTLTEDKACIIDNG